jgi:type II secretion system (T2SS) protein E
VSVAAPSVRGRPGDERRLLGQVLLETGLITADGLAAALAAQRLGGGRLGTLLMRGGHIVPAAFHLFLGEHLEALRPDIVDGLRSGAVAGLLPARLAHHYLMMPAREQDGVLDLAVATFDRPAVRPAVEAITGLRVEPIIAPPSLLAEAIGWHYPDEVEPGVRFRPAGDNVLVLADGARGLGAAALESLSAVAPAGEWLRAIVSLAVREGARRIEIEPGEDAVTLVFTEQGWRRTRGELPGGAYPGVAVLVDGLARIPARGRVVPREGRFAVRTGSGQILVSVMALPGHTGRIYRLDLRAERVVGPEAAAIAATEPGLRDAVLEIATRGRGLLGLAATGPTEWAAALDVVLSVLRDRPGHRAVIGAWDDPGETVLRGAAVTAAGAGDMLVIGTPWRHGFGAAVGALARERVVLAAVDAPDACAAAETIARSTAGTEAARGPAGVLAVRHLETPCTACRTPYDLGDLLALLPDASSAPAPAWIAPGCPACRGSGRIEMQRVAEFLPLEAGRLARPGASARRLREETPWRPTLRRAAVRGALAGSIDAREVVRLLVHEPRA